MFISVAHFDTMDKTNKDALMNIYFGQITWKKIKSKLILGGNN